MLKMVVEYMNNLTRDHMLIQLFQWFSYHQFHLLFQNYKYIELKNIF